MSFAAQYAEDVDENELVEGCVYWRARTSTSSVKIRSPVKRTPTAAQLPSPSATSSRGSADPAKRLLKRRKPIPSSSAPAPTLDKFALKCMDVLESKLASKIESPLRIVDPNAARLRSHSKKAAMLADSPLKRTVMAAQASPSRLSADPRQSLKSSLTATKAFSPVTSKVLPPRQHQVPVVKPPSLPTKSPARESYEDAFDGDDSFEMALSQLSDKQLSQSRKDAASLTSKLLPVGAKARPVATTSATAQPKPLEVPHRKVSPAAPKLQAAATRPNPFQQGRVATTTITRPQTIQRASATTNATTAAADAFRPAKPSTTVPARLAVRPQVTPTVSSVREAALRKEQEMRERAKAELEALKDVDLGDWSDDELV